MNWGGGPHSGVGPGGWRNEDWQRFRWIRRFMAGVFVSLFVMPVVLAVALTAFFAGWTGAAVAAIVSMSVLVAGVLLARFMFRSFGTVNELVGSTARLADGDYSARVSESGPPAFGPITRSFNDMAQRLETSDDLRRRLLADVGHELRTPLTIIRGELEAMADGVRTIDETEIRRLLVDVAGMERLLDDLKTLSTTEAGVLELHKEPVDIAALVEDVVCRLSGEAAGKDVTIEVKGPEAAVEIEADAHRLNEVFLNLLTNALRAVDIGGRITVDVGTEIVDTERWAMVSVADNGVGLAADQLTAVFDRFHRGPGSQGSGLGLTISQGLVAAHGGTIEATSVEGQGTIMTVRLPPR